MNVLKTYFAIPFHRLLRPELLKMEHAEPVGDLYEALKKTKITYYKETIVDERTGRIDIDLRFLREVAFRMKGLQGFLFVLGDSKKVKRTRVAIEMGYDALRVTLDGGVRIRLHGEWFQPMRRRFNRWERARGSPCVEIGIDRKVIIDHAWNIAFEGGNEFDFGPARIPGKNVIIEGRVAADLSLTRAGRGGDGRVPDGKGRGLVFRRLRLHVPGRGRTNRWTGEEVEPDLRIGSDGLAGVIADAGNVASLREETGGGEQRISLLASFSRRFRNLRNGLQP